MENCTVPIIDGSTRHQKDGRTVGYGKTVDTYDAMFCNSLEAEAVKVLQKSPNLRTERVRTMNLSI